MRALFLGLILAAVISAVLLVDFLPSNQVILNSGDASSQDILAPRDLTYNSQIRTEQAQAAQVASVQDIFDPPDATVARQQEVRARQIADYISTVRADTYASNKDQTTWIASIPDFDLPTATIERILALDEQDWQEVKDETVRVLVLAMRGEIKDSQIGTVRRRVPTLISHSYDNEQIDIIETLAAGLVRANTFYNAARTEQAQQEARDSTPPVTVTIRQGEAIIRTGDIVSPSHIEALDAFGIRQQEIRWQAVAGTILLSIVITVLLQLFVHRLQPDLWSHWKASLVVSCLIAAFVALGKLMLPVPESIIPYLYPLPALAMILTILFGPSVGIAAGVLVAMLSTYIAGGSLDITTYLFASTIMGALVLGRAERLRAFFWAGFSVALSNIAIIFVFGLLSPDNDILSVTIRALVGLVGGGMSASLTLAAFFALSALLDMITPFQLMELSRPTHPLFRQLLLKAPGTYHHTLLVANMAEEAAERIDADGLLARVGTYYHDIGKTVRPYFFTENRVGRINPHERLDPRTSAQIIISHVQDGLDLAEKYHLPSAVRAFIPEHHGDGLTLAFYRMALNAARENGQDVHPEDFQYPGPKPQSRETAITMLADSCEARVRSAEPSSVDEIEDLLADTIKSKLDAGLLDESNLTLRDLKEIQAAFLSVLKGVFHPRVKYPEPVKVTGADGKEIRV